MRAFSFLTLCSVFLLASCWKSDKKAQSADTRPVVAKYRCKPATTDKAWYTSGQKAPRFEGLSGIDFKITTTSQEAQEYFNQGMMLSYGFNHAEAARSFYETMRLDSVCAMGYWGYAYVLGPNYNAGMEPDNFQRAYTAIQKALTLMPGCTEKEEDMIRALSARYAKDPPEDRKSLDIAYSEAMKKVWLKYPEDPDIGALYAESMMDLHPWDLYEKDSGLPKAWTPELLNVLEKLMKLNPKHPGAHHFYIHAVEASANPEKGLASAKLLPSLVPGSGHIVHMPSHIYINTGHYHEGSLANIEAVKIDSIYTTVCHAQGAYPLAYYPHNYHFLTATATLEGNKKLAWNSAMKIQSMTEPEIMREPGWGTLQHYYTIPYYIAVKFSMWDTILSIAMPDSDLIYPRAVLHYARGMAFIGKHDLKNAAKELQQLTKYSKDSSLLTLTVWEINSTADLAQIAVNLLSGEIEAEKNNYQSAVSFMQKAIAIEDKLNYDEPPDWFFSVRHHLGTHLLKNGKYAEAEKAYREDLHTFPKNGWALYGLYQALEGQNKSAEAAKIKAQFGEAWKYADYKLKSTSPLIGFIYN